MASPRLYSFVQLFQLLWGPIGLRLTIRCGQQDGRTGTIPPTMLSLCGLLTDAIALRCDAGVDLRVEQLPFFPENEEVEDADAHRVYLISGRTKVRTGKVSGRT